MRRAFVAASNRLVFAHRGGARLAPENTIDAFEKALRLGVDGLEMDVRLSRDGVVVVHHDRLVDRTTNLRGEVSGFTADELARADAAYHFRPDSGWPLRGSGIGVPTLASVLERFRDSRIIVEMKVNSAEMARSTIQTVRAAGALDRVCLGSFGWRVLRAARTMEPAIATSAAREEVRWALYRSWVRWPGSGVAYDAYQVPEVSKRRRVVSRRFVEYAHQAGVPVHVWTIDTEDDARRLLAWGVDGLITDRPDVIVPIVRRSAEPPPPAR
jgi:glycerophosphoryl diester phosphodiesterase